MSNIKMIFHNLMELKYQDNYSEDVNEILMSYRHMREVDLINSLASIGLKTEKLKINLKNIENSALPCLLVADQYIENFCNNGDHLILSYDIHLEQHYLINDHDLKRQVDIENFSIKYALFIKQINHNELDNEVIFRNTEKSFPKWIKALLLRFKKEFITVISISLLNTITTIALALYAIIIYDIMIDVRDMSFFIPATTGIMLLLAINFTARNIRSNIITWCVQRLDYILEVAILEKVSNMSDHQRELEKIDFQNNRFEEIRNSVEFLSSENFLKLIDILCNTLLIFPIIFLSWQVALPTLILAPLYIFIYLYNISNIRLKQKEFDSLNENKNNLVDELKRTSEEIYLENLFPVFSTRLSSLSSNSCYREHKTKMHSQKTYLFSYCFMVGVAIISIAIGLNLIWNQGLEVGSFFGLMFLLWHLLTPAQKLLELLQKTDTVNSSFKKLHYLLCSKSETRTYRSIEDLYTKNFEIQFKSVSFQYPDTLENIFEDVNLTIKPNEIYGIHAGINSGKNAFIKLLNKTYLPKSGSIRIGGIDHRQFDTLYLRQYILTLNLKKSLLKDMSIYENIKYINPLISREDIMIHLGIFGVGELLEENGLTIDTPLSGSMKLKLSNELYSTIVLAIPFCTQAKVVLIEDIPSNMINEQFKLLKKFLKLSKGNFSVIFCSEHKEILKETDNIIYMAPGSKLSSGKKEELLNILEESALV
ncbi:ATP-binding cassette domain-containing protein [Halobacteriovorax sp. XZX-3]|uniref:ATP-binding cassette domain-containing protein n=1 Tax=unclassified Halobacteriovorax TaxID=2639665 RepID=UPI00371BB60D